MMNSVLPFTPEQAAKATAYCQDHTDGVSPGMQEAWQWTRDNFDDADKMSSLLQGATNKSLAQILQPKRILEIGSYSGFSAVAWQEATTKQKSEIITLEIEQRMIDATKETIKRNKMEDDVTLIEGPAQESLKTVSGVFDIIFVDADKEGYEGYVKQVLDKKLLSPNGIIICDNVFSRGLAIDTNAGSHLRQDLVPYWIECGKAMKKLNEFCKNDSRIDSLVLPLYDGMSILKWKQVEKRIEAKYPGIEIRSRVLRLELGIEANNIEPEMWKDVTLACLYLTHPKELMSKVRFIQLTSAGVDRWIHHERYQSPDVTFSTANGIHCPQIAEWVMSTWIMRNHNFMHHIESQQNDKKWSKTPVETRDSSGLRVGILGYGSVGRQIARLATAMGMEVYAYTRTAYAASKQAKSNHYSVPGMGDPLGKLPTRWFHGESTESVNEFLRQGLDLLVLCLPLTEATEYLIGSEQFDILAQGGRKTFISNVARGKLINTDALVAALQEGKIFGAAVDVTDPEPLPDSHPLFSAPNVIITPHVSWQSVNNWDRMLGILEINLDRLDRGEEPVNVLDRKRGY